MFREVLAHGKKLRPMTCTDYIIIILYNKLSLNWLRNCVGQII